MNYSLVCWPLLPLLLCITFEITVCTFPDDPIFVVKKAPGEELKNIVDILRKDYPEFYSLLEKSHSIEVIRNMNYVTILVPNWRAFRKMDSRTLRDIEQNPDALKRLVNGHIMQGRILSSQLQELNNIPTLNIPVYIQKQGGTFYINYIAANAPKIISLDIPAKNGIIHVIDRIIMPPTDRTISGYKNNK